jgi:hypothetical protein
MPKTTKTERLPLWSFDWKGGGYNQVRAASAADVTTVAASQFPSSNLVVAVDTIREVTDEKSFWANYPVLD